MTLFSFCLLLSCAFLPHGDAFTISTSKLLSLGSHPRLRELKASIVSDVEESSASQTFADFDWLQHWYPVSWMDDVRPNKPTRVSLFDVDYVLARTNDTEVTALVDVCPHKAAALSEGRVTASGLVQCAYHGWSFDKEGKCRDIPQTQATPTSACDATSIPAHVHQGMIWLWPGPQPSQYPDPPTIPEMDDFKVTTVIRDLPFDWTLLVSNIMDPDHGLFAHQASAFDFYSASQDFPMEVNETYQDKNFQLSAKVPSVYKVLAQDAATRGKKALQTNVSLWATTNFQAPTTVALCRRDADGKTKFVSGFWVCPTGTGRSRFMSASIGPLKVPRWLMHLSINNFLDQDNFLVASQEPPVLKAEKEGKPRKSLFAYASPTDKLVSRLDAFWDATIWHAPNRNVQKEWSLASRPQVLDRKVQHLDICPDSQDAVRNVKVLRASAIVSVAAWLARCLYTRSFRRRWLPVVASLVGWLSHKFVSNFYFNYPEWKRDRDLKGIPKKIWQD